MTQAQANYARKQARETIAALLKKAKKRVNAVKRFDALLGYQAAQEFASCENALQEAYTWEQSDRTFYTNQIQAAKERLRKLAEYSL